MGSSASEDHIQQIMVSVLQAEEGGGNNNFLSFHPPENTHNNINNNILLDLQQYSLKPFILSQQQQQQQPLHYYFPSATTSPLWARDNNNNNNHGVGGGGGDGGDGSRVRVCLSSTTKRRLKGRKKMREPRFCFKTMTDVDVLDDGYKWRKYGQKVVKNTLHPRSYYRCTEENCKVKKRIERLGEDPRMVITTYEGRHAHSPSDHNLEDAMMFSPHLPSAHFTHFFS